MFKIIKKSREYLIPLSKLLMREKIMLKKKKYDN